MRRLLLVVLALLVAACAAAIGLFVVDHGDRPMHADAVFVMSGSPTRLPLGLELVHEGYAPLLVVSRSEDAVTKLEQEACAHRLRVRVLCIRAHPYSTVGEAETLARLAAARGWRRLDVVTSQYHVVRARILIRRCYHGALRVVGAPDQLLLLPVDVALESVKLVYHELVHRGC